jgi:hypothetical protein
MKIVWRKIRNQQDLLYIWKVLKRDDKQDTTNQPKTTCFYKNRTIFFYTYTKYINKYASSPSTTVNSVNLFSIPQKLQYIGDFGVGNFFVEKIWFAISMTKKKKKKRGGGWGVIFFLKDIFL